MTNILITGATGLVGSHLLPLFGAGHEVHVLVRNSVQYLRDLPNICQHQVDLSRDFNTATLPRKIDAVIHLAQSARFREFPEQALDVFEVNVHSLMKLLNYAREAGASSFVVASSGGVYGSAAAPLREDRAVASTGGLGFYLSSKLCGEILSEAYAPFMNIVVLRLFFAYGPRQKRSMLIPRLIDSVRSGTPIVLSGADGIRINPVHANDAAAACKSALGVQGMRTINVAGPEVHSLRGLCEMIGSRVGRKPIFDVRAGGADADVIADTSLMTDVLGAPTRRISDHLGELL